MALANAERDIACVNRVQSVVAGCGPHQQQIVGVEVRRPVRGDKLRRGEAEHTVGR